MKRGIVEQFIEPPPPPAVYWPFDGSLTDVQQGHTLIPFANTMYVQGKHGQALSLDGIDDTFYLASHSDIELKPAWTITVWAYPTLLNVYHWIISKDYPDAREYFLRLQPAQLVWRCGPGDSGENTAGPPAGRPPITTHAWVFLALSYSASVSYETIRVWINGDQVDERHQSVAAVVTNSPLFIGRWGFGGYFWEGLIDEVGIYHAALTGEQIAYLYNDGEGQRPPFV